MEAMFVVIASKNNVVVVDFAKQYRLELDLA
jgi:hypothetical protein